MPLEDRDGILEESLEGSMELLLRCPGLIRLMETDFVSDSFQLWLLFVRRCLGGVTMACPRVRDRT